MPQNRIAQIVHSRVEGDVVQVALLVVRDVAIVVLQLVLINVQVVKAVAHHPVVKFVRVIAINHANSFAPSLVLVIAVILVKGLVLLHVLITVILTVVIQHQVRILRIGKNQEQSKIVEEIACPDVRDHVHLPALLLVALVVAVVQKVVQVFVVEDVVIHVHIIVRVLVGVVAVVVEIVDKYEKYYKSTCRLARRSSKKYNIYCN